MPLPLTVSCFSKIQIGFTFLVPAHLGSPGKRAVKRVCVCVWGSSLYPVNVITEYGVTNFLVNYFLTFQRVQAQAIHTTEFCQVRSIANVRHIRWLSQCFQHKIGNVTPLSSYYRVLLWHHSVINTLPTITISMQNRWLFQQQHGYCYYHISTATQKFMNQRDHTCHTYHSIFQMLIK